MPPVAVAAERRDRRQPAPSRCLAMRRLEPLLVARLEQHLESRKPEHVMERLGISLNTWDKILLGEPIRASVAERLVGRFCGQAS